MPASPTMEKSDKHGASFIAAAVMFTLGALLLILNLAGLFIPLRNPDIYTEPGALWKEDVTLSPEEFERLIPRREGESGLDYIKRANSLVNRAVAHFWPNDGLLAYRLTVPPWENYILFIMRCVEPEYFKRYEFSDWRRGAERGLGLCSQHAVILSAVLRDYNVDSYILALGGHVVVRARAEEGWVIADPDFGVFIPHDIMEVMARPQIVKKYYQGAESRSKRPSSVYTPERLAKIYGPHGNVTSDKLYYLHSMERYSYAAIWILPLILIAPLALWFIRRAFTARKKQGGG